MRMNIICQGSVKQILFQVKIYLKENTIPCNASNMGSVFGWATCVAIAETKIGRLNFSFDSSKYLQPAK